MKYEFNLKIILLFLHSIIQSFIFNPIVYDVRHERENGTCGWYIWGGNYSDHDDFFQPVHFFHIADIVPDYILKYLALTQVFKFITDENSYEDVWFESLSTS